VKINAIHLSVYELHGTITTGITEGGFCIAGQQKGTDALPQLENATFVLYYRVPWDMIIVRPALLFMEYICR
jgi:hypothetical protein